MTVELDDKIGAILKRQALEKNLSLDSYLEVLANTGLLTPRPEDISLEGFDALLDDISKGLDDLPCLPHDFSRVDIYAGRD